MLINDVISFEHPGPELLFNTFYDYKYKVLYTKCWCHKSVKKKSSYSLCAMCIFVWHYCFLYTYKLTCTLSFIEVYDREIQM